MRQLRLQETSLSRPNFALSPVSPSLRLSLSLSLSLFAAHSTHSQSGNSSVLSVGTYSICSDIRERFTTSGLLERCYLIRRKESQFCPPFFFHRHQHSRSRKRIFLFFVCSFLNLSIFPPLSNLSDFTNWLQVTNVLTKHWWTGSIANICFFLNGSIISALFPGLSSLYFSIARTYFEKDDRRHNRSIVISSVSITVSCSRHFGTFFYEIRLQSCL